MEAFNSSATTDIDSPPVGKHHAEFAGSGQLFDFVSFDRDRLCASVPNDLDRTVCIWLDANAQSNGLSPNLQISQGLLGFTQDMQIVAGDVGKTRVVSTQLGKCGIPIPNFSIALIQSA